jgi:Mlc titration factor MtfA (ptsG expression regulator)
MFHLFQRRQPPTLAPPLPEGWEAVVERAVPLARHLTPEEYRTFTARMAVFLGEKQFEGCGGLLVTEEMRVVVAAHACLLLAGTVGDVFPTVETVLLYPHAYKARTRERLGSVTIEREQARAGEAWGARGPLVLVWDEVQRASVVSEHNVVLHEFAHALDSENGDMDGFPVLSSRGRAPQWAAVLADEFAALKDAVREGRETDIDPYGATNPAEFFAVVTEAFFGTPDLLAENHPALYDELAAFYGHSSYRARVSGLRPPRAARPVERRLATRPVVRRLLLEALVLVLLAALYYTGRELFTRRPTGVVTGTVTSDSSELARTGKARVKVDGGREVEVQVPLGTAAGDYPTGTIVRVQVLESPVLGRVSYELADSQTDGPVFDTAPARRR